MKLEAGKRYVCQNRYVTHLLIENKNSSLFIFKEKDSSLSWTVNGSFMDYFTSELDIVAEYDENKEGDNWKFCPHCGKLW
jgi:hypothetical protein